MSGPEDERRSQSLDLILPSSPLLGADSVVGAQPLVWLGLLALLQKESSGHEEQENYKRRSLFQA